MTRIFLMVAAVLLAAPLAGEAGHVPVEELVKRIFTDANPVPYEVTADFDGILRVTARGQRVAARAAGTFREWRPTHGAPRRRTVNVATLDLPLLLRPFSSNLKKLIQERIEREEGALEIIPHYDMFHIADNPNGRIVLGGVRRDIVTNVLVRYGRAGEAKDDGTRRAIAKWLYQPRQRGMIVRPGGPYMVTVVTDEEGQLYGLVAVYDWGPVETKIEWATSGGRQTWREVMMDANTELSGMGRVDATLELRFSNHCFNCRR